MSMTVPITIQMMVPMIPMMLMMHGSVHVHAVCYVEHTQRSEFSTPVSLYSVHSPPTLPDNTHLTKTSPPPCLSPLSTRSPLLPAARVHHCHCARTSRDQHWTASKALTPRMANGHSHSYAHSVGYSRPPSDCNEHTLLMRLTLNHSEVRGPPLTLRILPTPWIP